MSERTFYFPTLGFIALLTVSSVFLLWYFSPESSTETLALLGGTVAVGMAIFSPVIAFRRKYRSKKAKITALTLMMITFFAIALYVKIGLNTLDYERIVLVNNSKFDMTGIRFEGIGTANHDKLPAGEKKSFAINILFPGELGLKYTVNDTQYSRILIPYTAPLLGSRTVVYADTSKHEKNAKN